MNWNLIIASLAVLSSVISYILTRRRDLAWKRTEFLCAQARYLDTDPVLVEAITILEGRHADITLAQLFGPDCELDKAKKDEYLQKFDKLLNFLWWLCYAYLRVKTISQKELRGFGWYLWRIDQCRSLVGYCEINGFEAINIVINKLDYIKKMRELHKTTKLPESRETPRK